MLASAELATVVDARGKFWLSAGLFGSEIFFQMPFLLELEGQAGHERGG